MTIEERACQLLAVLGEIVDEGPELKAPLRLVISQPLQTRKLKRAWPAKRRNRVIEAPGPPSTTVQLENDHGN